MRLVIDACQVGDDIAALKSAEKLVGVGQGNRGVWSISEAADGFIAVIQSTRQYSRVVSFGNQRPCQV